MKSDSAIMTEIAHKSNLLRVITPVESNSLKSVLMGIYKDLANVCSDNQLNLILVGGSALGAVRHNGFIPWDDDLDVGLIREEYNKLIELIQTGILDEKYEFTYPQKGRDSKNLFLKMYKKGTVFTELMDENTQFPKGIFIDIFPIDYAPSNKWMRLIKGCISDILSFISVSVLYAEYPSNRMREFMKYNSYSYRRYKQRKTIGKIGMLLGRHAKWAYWFDKYAERKRTSIFLTIPTGRKHYKGEVLDKDIFFPASVGIFEGISVGLPNKVDLYLSNLYGDYMTLPPEHKRERHYIVDIKL